MSNRATTPDIPSGNGLPAPAPGLSRAATAEVWRLAWPTVLSMTSYTVMQFVDKLMVAQVGPLEVAAQGNGGIWAFNVIAIAMGVTSVVNTFVAQHLGAGRAAEGSRYAWAGIWISVLAWLGLMLPWALVLPWIFSLMGHGEELARLETAYSQILLAGSVVLLANKALGHYFFGMHRPLVVTVAAIVGNLANVSLNYALIFGEAGIPHLGLPGVPGAPALGVPGAALATVLGTTIELLIPLGVFLSPRWNRRYATRAAWRPALRPMRDLVRLGWPAALQWGNEIICWSIFMSVLVGRFGADHMTAGWATLAYMHLSFMPAVGFSVAVSSLVGRYIGAGQPDVAAARARLGLALAMAYMTACAVCFVLFRHQLIGVFVGGAEIDPGQAERIVEIGAALMICAAIFQTADAVGVVYSGALRGAGDTVWPGLVTMVLSWSVIVGGGWILVVRFPGLESVGPWIAAAVYIIALGAAMAWRFEGGRWRSIRLVEPAAAPVPGPLPGVPGAPGDDAESLAADLMGARGGSRETAGAALEPTRSAD